MRSRNIKPGIFQNEVLGVADPLLTLLFEGLWLIADREGRLEDRPLRIRANVFPYRVIPDIDGLLTQLERMGFIQRYTVGGASLIQVINFKKHQSPHHTEKKSELPAPVSSPLDHGEYPLSNGGNPSDSLIPDSLIPDSRIDKTSLSELKTSSDEARPAAPKKSQIGLSKKACELAQLLKAEILNNKPDYRITPQQERKWAEVADRMLRVDKRSSERIGELIRWAQGDEFWRANVLSMQKLRQKFDELELRSGGSTPALKMADAVDEELLQYSTRILQEIGMTNTPTNRRGVSAALELLVREGRSKPSAYEFLLTHALHAGPLVDRWWFEDAKWRLAALVPAGKINTQVARAYGNAAAVAAVFGGGDRPRTPSRQVERYWSNARAILGDRLGQNGTGAAD